MKFLKAIIGIRRATSLMLHAVWSLLYQKHLETGPRDSQVPNIGWKPNLQDEFSLIIDGKWWHHHFSRLIHMYYTDQEPLLLTSSYDIMTWEEWHEK